MIVGLSKIILFAASFSLGFGKPLFPQGTTVLSAVSEQSEEQQEEGYDFSLGGVTTGVGLIAVGGAGAGVIAFNNKRKKKDTPSKEYYAVEEETKTEIKLPERVNDSSTLSNDLPNSVEAVPEDEKGL